jgi:hypothetical protein
MKALTVITPFADYQRGDQIKDADAMQAILGSHNSHHVVQVTLPDEKSEPSIAAQSR